MSSHHYTYNLRPSHSYQAVRTNSLSSLSSYSSRTSVWYGRCYVPFTALHEPLGLKGLLNAFRMCLQEVLLWAHCRLTLERVPRALAVNPSINQTPFSPHDSSSLSSNVDKIILSPTQMRGHFQLYSTIPVVAIESHKLGFMNAHPPNLSFPRLFRKSKCVQVAVL